MDKKPSHTGGCQCGAVRYAVSGLRGAGICHCRMCQKAFAAPYAALVTAETLTWTRGAPAHFRSSNLVRRGFCATCGTPLTYEQDGGATDVAILTLDDPSAAEPVIQLAREQAVPWCERVLQRPGRDPDQQAKANAFLNRVLSYQHPDHDTLHWPTPKDKAE
ncbi:GFA family protein [Roseibium aestuarii]|uniref:GFA family protein n=1 Tax=Roseibium aestuarii TaxID=2600299 RepID=A0ABW4JTF7_9HYPH|nr:GFA family protein [Roseibium aestuarii]